jgi:hypothetical protein
VKVRGCRIAGFERDGAAKQRKRDPDRDQFLDE